MPATGGQRSSDKPVTVPIPASGGLGGPLPQPRRVRHPQDRGRTQRPKASRSGFDCPMACRAVMAAGRFRCTSPTAT